VGRETLEETGKAPEGGGSEYIGGTRRWKAAVNGSERVQQGASGK
jgi:predicted secreted protein